MGSGAGEIDYREWLYEFVIQVLSFPSFIIHDVSGAFGIDQYESDMYDSMCRDITSGRLCPRMVSVDLMRLCGGSNG